MFNPNKYPLFPVSEAAFPSFPENRLPGEDYVLELLSLAEEIQRYRFMDLYADAKLIQTVQLRIGDIFSPICGQQIRLSAAVALGVYQPDEAPHETIRVIGAIDGSGLLTELNIMPELVDSAGGEVEDGTMADLYLQLAVEPDNAEMATELLVPVQHLESVEFFPFEQHSLN